VSDTELIKNEPESKRPYILRLISTHPLGTVVAFLGALASIVALVIAFFPWWTAPRRNLAYYVNPVRTPIVQAAVQSDVSVQYKGNTITGNVTAVQIAIWNAGREPIKHDDILSPIYLNIPHDFRVLDVSLLATTRDVTGFRVDPNALSLRTFTVNMDWTILEHNDGALLQIVYAGPPDAAIHFEGTIIGQQTPKRVTSITYSISALRWIVVIIATNCLTSVILVIMFAVKKPARLRRLILAIAICFCVLMIILLWVKVSLSIARTPFDF
jgi:amino acid transporter